MQNNKRKMSDPNGEIRKCEWCGRHLQVFGNLRVNGKQSHTDWETRSDHKQCWINFGLNGHDPPLFWKRQHDPEYKFVICALKPTSDPLRPVILKLST